MDQDKLKELVKDMKTDADLSAILRELTQLTVESTLEAEMDEHIGYVKHAPAGKDSGNSRNGSSSKRMISDAGIVKIDTPRNQDSSFSPVFMRKGQRRVTGMDEKILASYASGQSTRDIVASLKDLYDADISATLISNVTDRVMDQVNNWQNRLLPSCIRFYIWTGS